jgi:pilus assembly protein CpaE
VVAVYAPKGGVGRTTLAFNLAVALAGQGRKTCLVDACFQFGDLRSLLKVPADAPSILDLPTDRIGEADLADVLWRDPSRIDILLAPSRVELAEMISARDVEKVLSLLRRVYEAVVIDLPASLGDVTLAILDAADTILEIVTYDSTTLRNTQAVSDAFRAIGYAAAKIRYVVNRADSAGGIKAEDLARVLGRAPEHAIVSDGPLVVQANNEGVPFVLANPDAQVSRDVVAVASAILKAPALAAVRR